MLGVERWTFSATASAHHAQIVFVPCRRNTFARRVRPRFIRARRDSLLAKLAYVPILFVRHVPKFDRVLWLEISSVDRVRMKEPVADDQCSPRRLRPELMHHHVF